MAAPTSKGQFYRQYLAGRFGNKPRTWPHWAAVVAGGYRGRLALRNPVAGARCHYGVAFADLEAGRWPAGAAPHAWRFNEAMPDDRLALQGNALLAPGGLTLEFSTDRGVGHRDALLPPRVRSATGLAALLLLDHHLWPHSRDDLRELLDLYPEAVVEFSTYETAVGELPHRNTVFWEVRNY